MIPQDSYPFYFMIAASVFIVGACLVGVEMAHSVNNSTIWLGDEVTTSDRYTELFNDSFSGRVVSTDGGMYTVRDESGTDREFERNWLAKHGQEEI